MNVEWMRQARLEISTPLVDAFGREAAPDGDFSTAAGDGLLVSRSYAQDLPDWFLEHPAVGVRERPGVAPVVVLRPRFEPVSVVCR